MNIPLTKAIVDLRHELERLGVFSNVKVWIDSETLVRYFKAIDKAIESQTNQVEWIEP